MYILGIETSTRTGSIAIVTEQAVVAQYSLNIEITHSERLMETVDRVLRDTGLGITDMDGFAVAIGPGSFTGLRIGLAAAKGLAFAREKPLAAVPTLRALAENIPFAAYPVCPLLTSRKNEVYAALYRNDTGSSVQITAETVVPVSGIRSLITEKTVFVGEGALQHHENIASLLGDWALFAQPSSCLPSAAKVAELGLAMIRSGVQADPDAVTPLYISRPEAEIAWEKRNASQ
jgi:tRNA threonylcarbamoyladenosine biosynthesis protein TsaB